jgi:hypothetical protein
MAKDKDETTTTTAPPLSNITQEQANELRAEVTRLNRDLYLTKTELWKTRSELEEKQRQFNFDQQTYANNRAHHDRIQAELLEAREANIRLRTKLLKVHEAVASEVTNG